MPFSAFQDMFLMILCLDVDVNFCKVFFAVYIPSQLV